MSEPATPSPTPGPIPTPGPASPPAPGRAAVDSPNGDRFAGPPAGFADAALAGMASGGGTPPPPGAMSTDSMDSMEAVIGAIRPPRPPRRPGLPRRQRYALLAKLASDAHALSAALESAAATQAAIADMLTGKARDLRREVRESRRKLAEASRAVEGMQGSMATVRRDNEDLRERLAEKDEKIAELQSEYKRLRESGASDARTNIDDERRQLFNDLSQMLVQWPTVRNAIETGRDVKGRDLVGMLSRIDATFSRLGFETIGAVDAAVEFDERLHQPAGTADRVPVKGERVTVRFVGYRYKGEILRKAQVLPG